MLIGPGHVKSCLMPYANNKGADQPAHRRSLISTFVVRCLDKIMSLVSISEISRLYEPPHDITNEKAWAPSEDSDQPGHSPSLIRVFAVRLMVSQKPNASSCGQRRF